VLRERLRWSPRYLKEQIEAGRSRNRGRGEVELSDERESHIAEAHPELFRCTWIRSATLCGIRTKSGEADASRMHGCFQNGMMIS
jgi:hypothetical protein